MLNCHGNTKVVMVFSRGDEKFEKLRPQGSKLCSKLSLKQNYVRDSELQIFNKEDDF